MARQIPAAAIEPIADIFGDGMFAMQVGPRFSCYEADRVAQLLDNCGYREQAITWLIGHADGDDEPDDVHRHLNVETETDEVRQAAVAYLEQLQL